MARPRGADSAAGRPRSGRSGGGAAAVVSDPSNLCKLVLSGCAADADADAGDAAVGGPDALGADAGAESVAGAAAAAGRAGARSQKASAPAT